MDCKLVRGRGRPKTDGKADGMCKYYQHDDMRSLRVYAVSRRPDIGELMTMRFAT